MEHNKMKQRENKQAVLKITCKPIFLYILANRLQKLYTNN